MNDAGQFVGFIIVLIPLFFIFCAYVLSLVWVYADAEERGKPGCLVVLLVALLSWPISLLVWVVFRPPKQE